MGVKDMHLNYFYHPYNNTVCNERCVEVALAMEFIKRHPHYIEIGAVLPYYTKRGKRVIDCFDPEGDNDKRLAECDIRGENVVCISTLEHFGTEEYGNKKLSKLEGLAGLLQIMTTAENYFITIPLGFNKTLDNQLAYLLPELNCYGFERSIDNPGEWKMVNPINRANFFQNNLYNLDGFSFGERWIYGGNFIVVITSEEIEENITFSQKKISPPINEIKYHIYNPNDTIEECCLNSWQWASDTYEKIKNIIQEKKLTHFLNVGAHIGTLSLPLSLHINKVTAIEPYPPTYRKLVKNIKLNEITNIESHNIALGNSHEEAYFVSEKASLIYENGKQHKMINNIGGMHCLKQSDIEDNIRHGKLTDKKYKSDFHKLDDLEIDKFDIMLIDAEGGEYEILQGAKKKILTNKPVIIIEIWPDDKRREENMPTTKQEIIDLIKSFGYQSINEGLNEDNIFYPI